MLGELFMQQYGTVSWYVPEKGFGMIEGGNEDLFFLHGTQLQDSKGVPFESLEGKKVAFETTEGVRGLSATNVRLI